MTDSRVVVRLLLPMLAALLFVLVGAAPACTQPTQPVIEITPETTTLVSGQQVQLTVTRHFPGGPVENVTDRVTYASTNKNAASVSDRGLVTAGVDASPVTVRVTDLSSDATSAISITISAPRIDRIEITPSPAVVLRPGATSRFTAQAHLNNGVTRDVTTQVLWASTNEAAATVGRTAADFGVVTAIAEGDTTISATDALTFVQGRTIVFVRGDAPGLAALVVTPNPTNIAINGTLQFVAQGVFTDGSKRDLTNVVTWSSSNFGVVSIDATGLAKGVAAGDATITALGASGTVKGSAAAKVQ